MKIKKQGNIITKSIMTQSIKHQKHKITLTQNKYRKLKTSWTQQTMTHLSVSGGSRLLEKSTVFRAFAEEKKSVADAGLSLARRLMP